MDIWNIATYAAWIISIILLLWMLVDAFSISKHYNEEFLMSSREGAEELTTERNRGKS